MQDTDNDFSPEIVEGVTVVLGIPFEDGQEFTRGDEIKDNKQCNQQNTDNCTFDNPYPWNAQSPPYGWDFSSHLREKDASRFGCVLSGTSICQ